MDACCPLAEILNSLKSRSFVSNLRLPSLLPSHVVRQKLTSWTQTNQQPFISSLTLTFLYLDASMHLYQRLCPSVSPLVHLTTKKWSKRPKLLEKCFKSITNFAENAFSHHSNDHIHLLICLSFCLSITFHFGCIVIRSDLFIVFVSLYFQRLYSSYPLTINSKPCPL